jgi:general secretion pathway protein G
MVIVMPSKQLNISDYSPHAIRKLLGFTLIELLVVLAIIATLATLVAPRYLGQTEAAKEAVLRDNLRLTRDVIDKFYGDTGRYPESLEELIEKKYLRNLPSDPISESDSSWQLIDVPAGYKGRVYDIKSNAQGNGRDGKPFNQW